MKHWSGSEPVLVSVAVLAEISLRSPRKIFIFIIKYIFTGSKYPKNKSFNFENNCTAPGDHSSMVIATVLSWHTYSLIPTIPDASPGPIQTTQPDLFLRMMVRDVTKR